MATGRKNDGLRAPGDALSFKVALAGNMGAETGHTPGVPRTRGRQSAFASNTRPRSLNPEPREAWTRGRVSSQQECMVETPAVEHYQRTRRSAEVAGRAALARTPSTARAMRLTAGWYLRARVVASMASVQVRRCQWSRVSSGRRASTCGMPNFRASFPPTWPSI